MPRLVLSLQNVCEDDVKRITSELSVIMQKAKDNQESLDLQQLQNDFLPKIVQEEGMCDQKFTQLLNQAQAEFKQAGFADMDVQSWKDQYQQFKDQARAAAIAQLTK